MSNALSRTSSSPLTRRVTEPLRGPRQASSATQSVRPRPHSDRMGAPSDLTRTRSDSRIGSESELAARPKVPADRARVGLRNHPLRRAADNAVNLLVLGGVIASFITPVGHIALAVGLGLSMATSLPDWASKQNGPQRRAAAILMGVTVGLAFGSVMAVLAVGTGPVGWTLSALASAAALARLGLLMHAHRGHGTRHALRAALYEFVNLKLSPSGRPAELSRPAGGAAAPERAPSPG